MVPIGRMAWLDQLKHIKVLNYLTIDYLNNIFLNIIPKSKLMSEMLTIVDHLLLNLRSPRDYVVRSSVRHVVRSRLWYVLDRQLLNG